MQCHSGKEVNANAARSGEVVTKGDYLRGQLASFRRRVHRALALVEEAAAIAPVGVCFSGGKDSTVLLHLVRRVLPEAPAGFFDSGAELADTLALMAATPNLTVIPAEPSLIEMCRAGGYWGAQTDTPDLEFDFGEHLIFEPSRQFRARHNLEVLALGLRAQESVGRWFNARRKGALYWHQGERVWHLCPLQDWSTDDIWAYIAVNEVPYNRAYDRMAGLGMDRDQMRVSCALGADAVGFGRYAYLKQLDPELWNRLVAVFPKLAVYV